MALQLRTLVKADGTLELSLTEAPQPEPKAHEVVIEVQATPINPSDLGLLLAGADLTEATQSENEHGPVVTTRLDPILLRASGARVDQSLPAGNEGAGVVVAAGSNPEAQALLGKTVAGFGGGMYANYRALPASQCLLLNEGTTAKQGASCFVNPLTALAMPETMRMEGHKALVHTAAASNLGQMLVRICQADNVPLVNIVRKQEQVDLLKGMGAEHVVDSSQDNFREALTDALKATGATIAFDAIGGGKQGGQILACMEAAAMADPNAPFNRYGSDVHKQLYIYGGLDRGPTTFNRGFGFSFSIGGFLLMPFLAKVGPEVAEQLRRRVADEVTTTFDSQYSHEVSLAGMLNLDSMRDYARMATGEKTLVLPG